MKKSIKAIILTAAAVLAFNTSASAQRQYKDIFDMIRGIPGVQVGQADSGSMPSIIIRGIGTNSTHTQPLFVVDGIITDNISTIDPNDVDSIDVIKDGTSSIYGVQGANGVIMVTTKSAVEAARREAEMRRNAKALARQNRKNKNKDKNN